MAKNLIVIPCCKRKIVGGAIAGPMTYFDNPDAQPNLITERGLRIQANPTINALQFLPAWKRYDGNLYRKLKDHQLLIDMLRANNCLDIIIVSALYGVINYDTYINEYDLEMNGRLAGFWGNVLPGSINDYCQVTGVENLYTFLRPVTYYAAINVGLRPHTQFWPHGLRGNNNIYNEVAFEITGLLNTIRLRCW